MAHDGTKFRFRQAADSPEAGAPRRTDTARDADQQRHQVVGQARPGVMPQIRELRVGQSLGQLTGIDQRRYQDGMPFDSSRHRPEPPQHFSQALDNITRIFGPGLIAVDKHELKPFAGDGVLKTRRRMATVTNVLSSCPNGMAAQRSLSLHAMKPRYASTKGT